jgi:2-dehydropantoate 2-reductase
MRVAILGAGAIGCYLGAHLLASGASVCFYTRGETLRVLRTRGIEIEDEPDVLTFGTVEATDDIAAIRGADVAIVAVKAWQLDEVLRAALPLLGPDTLVLLPQNGVESQLAVAHAVGSERTVVGLVRLSCVALEPGRIRRLGGQVIELGTLAEGGHHARVEALCRALGPRATMPDDIFARMWDKAVVMATMSLIGMAARTPIPVLTQQPELLDLAVRAAAEAVAVAVAHGARLDVATYGAARFQTIGAASAPMSSTQRDFLLGRPSELDAAVGFVPRLGRKLDVPTPIFDVLYAMLSTQELVAREKLGLGGA